MSGSSNPTVWEFSANGSVLIDKTRGRYTLGQDDRIKIQTPFATSVYQIQISGDQMILRTLSGAKLEFTRIKKP